MRWRKLPQPLSAGRDYLADSYSIADMACIGWVSNYEAYEQKLEDYPNLQRWYCTLRERPAVQKGLELGREMKIKLSEDATAQQVLFNQKL